MGQSYITSVFTTLRSLAVAAALVWKFKPDVVGAPRLPARSVVVASGAGSTGPGLGECKASATVPVCFAAVPPQLLVNGPGTCIPLCLTAFLLRCAVRPGGQRRSVQAVAPVGCARTHFHLPRGSQEVLRQALRHRLCGEHRPRHVPLALWCVCFADAHSCILGAPRPLHPGRLLPSFVCLSQARYSTGSGWQTSSWCSGQSCRSGTHGPRSWTACTDASLLLWQQLCIKATTATQAPLHRALLNSHALHGTLRVTRREIGPGCRVRHDEAVRADHLSRRSDRGLSNASDGKGPWWGGRMGVWRGARGARVS